MTTPEQAQPPYARIVAEIRARITGGDLQPGDRVPSTRDIVRDRGVAMATATKVLTSLRHEGLVVAVPGLGTVVAEPAAAGRQDRLERPARSIGTDRSAPGVRKPGQEVARESVVRTAVTLADSEGIGAVSMRRVAVELGSATMSLYRHVDGKDQLVLLMADMVFAEGTLPDPPPAGWRAQLECCARLQWEIFNRHPWLAGALSITRPQALPNLAVHTEWTLRALRELDLDAETTMYAHIALFNHVRGTALNLEPEATARVDSGMTGDEWVDTQKDAFDALVSTGRFPFFTDLYVELSDFNLDLNRLFELGLRWTLDGLASLSRQPKQR